MLPSSQPSANPTDFPSSSPTMTHAPTGSPTIETRTCWLKTAIAITFAESRTLIPQSPTKIGQLVVTERDFTLKFTYHPSSSNNGGPGSLLSLKNNNNDFSSWQQVCYPCVWHNNYNEIYFYWILNVSTAIPYYLDGAGLVLNQDNEVKISLISNVVSIYINGSLKKSVTVRSDSDEVSALDVYLQTAGNFPTADGYIQNLKYIPGGEA